MPNNKSRHFATGEAVELCSVNPDTVLLIQAEPRPQGAVEIALMVAAQNRGHAVRHICAAHISFLRMDFGRRASEPQSVRRPGGGTLTG